jgi:hypothetical protein
MRGQERKAGELLQGIARDQTIDTRVLLSFSWDFVLATVPEIQTGSGCRRPATYRSSHRPLLDRNIYLSPCPDLLPFFILPCTKFSLYLFVLLLCLRIYLDVAQTNRYLASYLHIAAPPSTSHLRHGSEFAIALAKRILTRLTPDLELNSRLQHRHCKSAGSRYIVAQC